MPTFTQSHPSQPALEESSIGLPLVPVRQRALRESVFEVLLSAIVRGEMKPGVWSNHQRLAEHLAVSVTPLREALQELAACGIIESRYNRGTVVRPFGRPQLSEIFYVRALLEAEATRLACSQIDHGALAKLQAKTSDLMAKETPDWSSDVIATDDRLHSLIADSCGNQRLKEEISRYRSLLMSIRRAVADHHYPFIVALPEHLAIIEALLRRDVEQAVEAMKRHILSSAKICGDVLFPPAKENN
ncbi:MAG TPA: GntR family transcriptional regulator [Verrucomicrobiae bacterium]|jgi:DNA-binding GntR family transcriptional regulator|nr:GntR family transcriptional regulator [Verrucomicrobiae bacterium]